MEDDDDLYRESMAGRAPSAVRGAAIILAAVALPGAEVVTPPMFLTSVPLPQAAHLPVQVMEAGLLLFVKPQLLDAYLLSVA